MVKSLPRILDTEFWVEVLLPTMTIVQCHSAAMILQQYHAVTVLGAFYENLLVQKLSLENP